MQFLEFIYYESLPFVYAAISAATFHYCNQSIIATAAALVLAACSFIVFGLRFNYRVKRQKLN